MPQLINYQGRLLNGTNLVNGNVGLSLRLFNVPSGGASLYEDSNAVTVTDGLYSTFIGDNTTGGSLTNALTNAAVFVEVAVNGIALTPRERVASVPYALATRGLLVGQDGRVVVVPDVNAVSNFSDHAVIGGGRRNTIAGAPHAVISGGRSNNIADLSNAATVGGGRPPSPGGFGVAGTTEDGGRRTAGEDPAA